MNVDDSLCVSKVWAVAPNAYDAAESIFAMKSILHVLPRASSLQHSSHIPMGRARQNVFENKAQAITQVI